MTQNTWTCWNFNKLPRGSNDDGFVQTKYEHEQYDNPNTMRPTLWHGNNERGKQQISKTRLKPHTDDAHDATWLICWRDNMKEKMVK